MGWREPWFALAFPALMLINATLFHVLPTVVTRVYSPGLVTAVALFCPIAGWVYYGAWKDRVLTTTNGILSTLLGAGIMATPIVLLRIKGWKMFAYAPSTEDKHD
ncbi:MAG: HXXEE domain-containing protein [Planctomycetales bacterium]